MSGFTVSIQTIFLRFSEALAETRKGIFFKLYLRFYFEDTLSMLSF